MTLPQFFNYKEENTNNGYETMQDFFISWTLRCAEKKWADTAPKVHYYSKQVLFGLIKATNNPEGEIVIPDFISEIEFMKVKTRRQWKKIDLVAEVEYKEGGVLKSVVLNIENKWYSSLKPHQLEQGRADIEVEFSNDSTELKHIVLFCDSEMIYVKHPEWKQLCRENGYVYVTIEAIMQCLGVFDDAVQTGNPLFDVYWFDQSWNQA